MDCVSIITILIHLYHYLHVFYSPNVITLSGLMINVFTCLWLYFEYGHSFDGYISTLMCYTIGIGFTFYIILDGMDGKQARKTGNASPLGMLFDHGCDIITSCVNSSLM